MKRIYLDYASLTPIDARVVREMEKYSSPGFANPSSIYREGVLAKKGLEDARGNIAGFVRAHGDEIVFTSGGTEANALALEGCGRAAHRAGIAKPHLIISSIEHSSIMETAAMLEKSGVSVTRLSVDCAGLISPDELKRSITPNTYLVSIMTVNNETGVVQPIRDIAKIIRQSRVRKNENKRYPLLHTDAAQAFLYEDLNVERLGLDLMTLDGSKVYGPRGIGALYVRRNTPIEPIIYGGGQERGLRSGTENLPAVMGFAKALQIADKDRVGEAVRLSGLRGFFLDELKKIRPDISVNPSVSARPSDVVFARGQKVTKNFVTFGKSQMRDMPNQSPHILNVSIPGIDNEFFVLQLDAKGISCSTKSSCLRDEDESYVLKAMGADSKTAVRFSFGRWTKIADIKKTVSTISSLMKTRS